MIAAKPAEVDVKAKVWTVPAERMKANRHHRVPLSDPAILVIEGLKARVGAAFLFPGQKADKPISNMAMTKALRRMKRDQITVHGFRSTFRDWAAERTQHERDTVEMALAHKIPDNVEAAYRRGDLLDKRRALMADWAAYCWSSARSMRGAKRKAQYEARSTQRAAALSQFET